MRNFINNTKAKLSRGLSKAGFGAGVIEARTELHAKHIRNGKVIGERTVLDKVVTDDFVDDVVGALRGVAGNYGTFDDYKFHASGTGSGAESTDDSTLGTEVESRATGSQEAGATTNVYKSVATITYTGSHAIEEHGLFNESTGGTLMDRTVFSVINVEADDAIQFTFTIQFNSGG